MSAPTIRFDDGTVYERMMGKWSGLIGNDFIDWLSPPPNLRWVDIGCGNGAFTQLLIERCAPVAIEGVDPSEGQLAFARERLATPISNFRQGDAMALPFLITPMSPPFRHEGLSWLANRRVEEDGDGAQQGAVPEGTEHGGIQPALRNRGCLS